MNKETIKISGMTCAACANRIEKVVGRLDGVSGASVNFATEKLTVDFDGEKTTVQNIKEIIERLGYGVVEEVKSKQVIIPIEGMSCAA